MDGQEEGRGLNICHILKLTYFKICFFGIKNVDQKLLEPRCVGGHIKPPGDRDGQDLFIANLFPFFILQKVTTCILKIMKCSVTERKL